MALMHYQRSTTCVGAGRQANVRLGQRRQHVGVWRKDSKGGVRAAVERLLKSWNLPCSRRQGYKIRTHTSIRGRRVHSSQGSKMTLSHFKHRICIDHLQTRDSKAAKPCKETNDNHIYKKSVYSATEPYCLARTAARNSPAALCSPLALIPAHPSQNKPALASHPRQHRCSCMYKAHTRPNLPRGRPSRALWPPTAGALFCAVAHAGSAHLTTRARRPHFDRSRGGQTHVL